MHEVQGRKGILKKLGDLGPTLLNENLKGMDGLGLSRHREPPEGLAAPTFARRVRETHELAGRVFSWEKN
jgi:hypothetical protein